MTAPVLLSILELGGYPDFSSLYQSLGYQAEVMTSMRKALKFIKSQPIDTIVAEFNFQSDFRDRSSQLESLMASIAQKGAVNVIVFYDIEQKHQFERVEERYDFLATFSYPINEKALAEVLRK